MTPITLSHGTVSRLLVWRTASPAHADFAGLRSLAVLVIVRLVVVPLPPSSSTLNVTGCLLGGFLLDVISGVEITLLEGCTPH